MLTFLLLGLALAGDATPPHVPVEAVVRLVQGAGTCAGAFIDDAGTVATAYHCVAKGGRPKVWTHDGRVAVGRVISVDVAGDLALVSAPELAGTPWLPLADAPGGLGATVRAIGHPLAGDLPSGYVEGLLRWSVSQGVIAAVGPRAVQTTAPLNPGNSGGPLIDDDGALVGVVSRRFGGQGIGFATRAERVAALMAGEGRSFGPLGGTLALDLFLASYQAGIGSIALGGRLEVSLRDRVVLGGALGVPLDARWAVARYEEPVRWSSAEARAGLRQRLGRGTWTTTLDAYGGVASLRTLRPDTEIVYRGESALAPMAGGALTVQGVSLDLAVVFVDGAIEPRLQAVLRFPGVFWMF